MPRSSNKIPVEWIKHLPPQEKDNFETTLRNSTIVLDRLREILFEHLRSIETKEYSETSYENPSWACKQAFLNGRKAELTKLIKLTDFIGENR